MDIHAISSIDVGADVDKLLAQDGTPSIDWTALWNNAIPMWVSLAWRKRTASILSGIICFFVAAVVHKSISGAASNVLLALSATLVAAPFIAYRWRRSLWQMGSSRYLSRDLRARVAAFNEGLDARKAIDAVARKTATQDLYDNDVAQWERRGVLLVDEAFKEFVARDAAIKRKAHAKALRKIGKSLDVLEPLDPKARETRDYASLALRAQVDEEIKKS